MPARHEYVLNKIQQRNRAQKAKRCSAFICAVRCVRPISSALELQFHTKFLRSTSCSFLHQPFSVRGKLQSSSNLGHFQVSCPPSAACFPVPRFDILVEAHNDTRLAFRKPRYMTTGALARIQKRKKKQRQRSRPLRIKIQLTFDLHQLYET